MAYTPSLQNDSFLADYLTDMEVENIHKLQLGDPMVFEVAVEVANDMTNLFTTLRSKAARTVAELGADGYCMVGICTDMTTQEVDLHSHVLSPGVMHSIRELEKEGITALVGKWLIEGAPNVILFDLEAVDQDTLSKWVEALENKLGIVVPADDQKCLDSIAFSGCVSRLLFHYHSGDVSAPSSILHLHSTSTAPVIPLLSGPTATIHTIYTAHETALGQRLSTAMEVGDDEGGFDEEALGEIQGGLEFPHSLASLSADRVAKALGMEHLVSMERAAVKGCKVFTAVSAPVADEARQWHGRGVDVVLPNGINANKLLALHEFQELHAQAKGKIHDFVLGHFHGCKLNKNRMLYIFGAGMYAFKSKGIDVFLDALAKLNRKLKEQEVDVTVVAFLIYPSKDHDGFNAESLHAQGVANRIREATEQIADRMAQRMLDSAYAGKQHDPSALLTDADRILLRRCIQAAKRDTVPPVTTHEMVGTYKSDFVTPKSSPRLSASKKSHMGFDIPASTSPSSTRRRPLSSPKATGKGSRVVPEMSDDIKDPILNKLAKLKLLNAFDDKVKIIFHPEFLSSSSPLFRITYEDFMRGCHLGVFPSLYEPWGYTATECAALGLPVVTSDTSGFGSFVETQIESVEEQRDTGLYVLKRKGGNGHSSKTTAAAAGAGAEEVATQTEISSSDANGTTVEVEEAGKSAAAVKADDQLADILWDFCGRDRAFRIKQRNRTEEVFSAMVDWVSLAPHYTAARRMAMNQ